MLMTSQYCPLCPQKGDFGSARSWPPRFPFLSRQEGGRGAASGRAKESAAERIESLTRKLNQTIGGGGVALG